MTSPQPGDVSGDHQGVFPPNPMTAPAYKGTVSFFNKTQNLWGEARGGEGIGGLSSVLDRAGLPHTSCASRGAWALCLGLLGTFIACKRCYISVGCKRHTLSGPTPCPDHLRPQHTEGSGAWVEGVGLGDWLSSSCAEHRVLDAWSRVQVCVPLACLQPSSKSRLWVWPPWVHVKGGDTSVMS